ncbi:MAG: sigma-70 family RNA polymerase sigma factor [Hydrogenophaga sp.]|uniref:RNA polymerase sigma factor n=1 Tax=Hydrogenophaga sp. TaxID=1904254 RepID=UPI00169660BD|nr:RNA polymerase sigma factor [Hydrogenophaga sp.]NIM40571.1 sigma-70 family RNA polymerase sigma factor [Hydrogenophaga sp.]NIN25989.1 sigma-70 family RNA polymerase sigma factor [Hydrogenophaga sp.]NIN30861.1 sigma-70 family RNA polymerase sigma factor [Hydrogenophaga sp.]NIN54954.1 sigma-70 family RNA polymerase sigma factor [Hydrogenophaga sp.]NIO50994.1 sigma-70 family RNA polymerase sigma factor [Hydrogenophaga sp.]
MHSAIHQRIAATWRLESAKVVAAVMRRVRDLGVAEDIAQDALVAALEHWPKDGIPDKPGAWLMRTALNRALDHLRQRATREGHEADIAADLVALQADRAPDVADQVDAARRDPIGDDLLRLIFTACHPVLSADARVALTLKLLGGLSTHEIARAVLQTEPTVAQRIVRAQRTLRDAGVPFELPHGPALAERLGSVLEVIYLIFNEGYTATRGSDWMRPALCDEALRLARVLADLMPREPEVLGLQALLEIQASRSAARTDAQGRPVLLEQQDRARWDRLLIRRGLDTLSRADLIAESPGPYQLQAAIAACHARAASVNETDWARMAALYAELARITPSPVVELNRAVAVSRHAGPAAGLAVLAPLLDEPALARYPWLSAVRGDLLQQLGRADEAREAFERAAGLTENEADRALMRERADALRDAPSDQPRAGRA